MNRLKALISFGVLAALLPIPALAVEPDPYADAVFAVSNQVLSPANALGAPDSVYADFFQKDATVTLDMGEGEEGTGDLIMTMKPLNFGASYRVELMDESFSVLLTHGDLLPLDTDEVRVAYDGSVPYRYVRVTSIENETWRLDALEAVTTTAPSSPPPEEPGQPEAPSTPTSTHGLLLKLLDDGNPATDVDAAVYAIGSDGKRHAFPSFRVYQSWYPDFSTIAFIDVEQLATYTLGGNVTVRPGTYLVKITTDPKVYAVEPGGVLRWVSSETTAVHLYGAGWASRVIDVPDVFFRNYTMGDPIFSDIHPDGSVGAVSTGEVVYISHGTAHPIPGEVFANMRFMSDFFVPINNTQEALYGMSTPLTADPSIQYPH